MSYGSTRSSSLGTGPNGRPLCSGWLYFLTSSGNYSSTQCWNPPHSMETCGKPKNYSSHHTRVADLPSRSYITRCRLRWTPAYSKNYVIVAKRGTLVKKFLLKSFPQSSSWNEF